MSKKTKNEIDAKFDSIQAGLRHVSEMVIFLAAYELGERAGKGENVDAELAQWQETLKKNSEARGF